MEESIPPNPVATVPSLMALMFTDIVNSSDAKSRLGMEEYRPLKKRHDELIREALLIAPTGRVLQDTGDGYFLSFGSVAQAIAMALKFQRLMAAEQWTHPICARVGIHLGEVETGHSDLTGQPNFFSSAIDQASRVTSLGAGGQVLLTRAVYDAARHVVRAHPVMDSQSPPLTLKWLFHGNYLFKGTPNPVEVFEVGAEGLAPLCRPEDSEKAHLMKPGELPRRAMGTGTFAERPSNDWPPLQPQKKVWHHGWAVKIGLIAAMALGLTAGWYFLGRNPDLLSPMQKEAIQHEIQSLLSRPPVDLKSSPNMQVLDKVDVGDNGAFDVLEDHRVLDLRNWKEVPPDAIGTLYSPCTMTIRRELSKNAPAQFYEVQARTNGTAAFIQCDESFPNTFLAQKEASIFANTRLKLALLRIDVGSVAVGQPFTLHCATTYWNDLQTQEERWFGVIGYKNTLVSTLLTLFPKSLPYKEFNLTVSRTVSEGATEFTGPRIVMTGPNHDWIYWEIPHPAQGYVYRLDWKW
jgi:class 3 adenylate cyclase